MRIAVTGATGHLGTLVINKLKKKVPAGDLIALARNTAKAESLGVEAREFDYSNVETLVSALQGVDKLLFISSSELGGRALQHRNVIDAAREVGVGYIAYTSILRADTSSISLAKEHYATETDLQASGIPHTLLRNGWYTENYTASIGPAVENGAFIGSAGDGKISSAAREDFADAAVAVLTNDDQAGKIYELAGDNAYTLSELAAEISRQTGKSIPYINMPKEEYSAVLVKAGLPEPVAELLSDADVRVSEGALFDNGRQLSKLIGRPTTPMADSMADALKGL